MKILLLCQPGILLDGVKCLISQLEPHLTLVGATDSGREGLDLARAKSPDIVLIAFGLTEVNTVDTIGELSQELEQVRILILGEDLRNEPLAEALRAGAHGCITPEAGAAEFREAFACIMGGERYLCLAAEEVLIDLAIHHEGGQDPVFTDLSPREREVLKRLADGKHAKEIASTLNLSSKTVDTHRAHIMKKLDLDNVPDLVRAAIRACISDLEVSD